MAPSETPPPQRSKVLRVGLALLTLHGAVFALLALTGTYAEKGEWRRLYESGGFLPLQLASMAAFLHASRRRALPDATRRGLRFLGAAFGVIALGSAVWLTMEAVGTPLAYISWADLIFFQFYPLLVLGLWSLPTAEPTPDVRRDLIGKVVVLVVFGSLIAFAAGVEAQARSLSTALRVMVVLSGSAQLVTLLMVNRGIERARPVPSARAIYLLLSALALSVISDLISQVLFSTGYDGRNWGVVASIATNLLVLMSALRFAEDPVAATSPESESVPTAFNPLPIIAVSALALTLVWMAGQSTVIGIGPLLVGLVFVNALVVLREIRASRAATRLARAGAQREATRRVEALVRHASDAILLLSAEGRLLFASAPADGLFERPLGGLEGGTIDAALPEGDREEWQHFVASLATSDGQPMTFTFRRHVGGEQERLIECVGLDLRAEPAVGGLVIHSRDITDRARLEDRLRQSQKLEVAGRLAGGVAHDFNNVLTAVIAGTELAQMSLDAGHPAMQDLKGVEAAAQRGAALTRRLLAFVRQEPVPAQSVDLRQMLLELEPLLNRLSGEANPVTVEVPHALGAVQVDRTELEHIIFNLVANSRDATPMGGPIFVRAELVDLSDAPGGAVILPPPGRHARIAVTDRGDGMSDETRRRMFDPFFTQKSGGRGTGLGLIGVRPLVEGALGGLTVESIRGGGTTVALYLPPSETSRAGVPPLAGTLAPPRRSSPVRTPALGTTVLASGELAAVAARRVLLVEDELPVREQLIRLIDALGYSSVAVGSAGEARALLTRDPNAVCGVVSDVMMPGETGIEFANWLRTAHPHLPVLLISGHTGTALDREARSSSDFELLHKPFTGAQLAARLEVMLATGTDHPVEPAL